MISIAIDGPSGSGKSTLAKALAKELGFLYIDTGAMYRAVGLYAFENGIDPKDEQTLSAHFDHIKISLAWENGTQKIYLDGKDVSEDIRLPQMSMYASAVSALPAVRQFLLDRQRDFAKTRDVIMDGRDIGTVVLPDATVKIFLSADDRMRAQRRYDELVAKGVDTTFESVLFDMQLRDKNDAERAASPCVPAKDAVLFDNSGLAPEETLRKALEIIHAKSGQ